MDARYLGPWHGEHAEGVGLAQVGRGGEGEAPDVLEPAQVARMHARGVEALPVVRHMVIGMLQRPLQALQLQRAQLVDARAFDRFERQAAMGQAARHGAGG